MTITNTTTIGQLQLELAKLGVNSIQWASHDTNHVVLFSGPSLEDITGCGKSLLEALDDAMTSLLEFVRADLYKVS